MIEAEDVVGVVAGLHTREPVVVGAIGFPNPVMVLIPKIVHVHGVFEVRAHRLEAAAGPIKVAVGVGRVIPLGQDQAAVLPVAVGNRGGLRVHAAVRSGHLLEPIPAYGDGHVAANSGSTSIASSVRFLRKLDFQ